MIEARIAAKLLAYLASGRTLERIVVDVRAQASHRRRRWARRWT
jgi:hypothetical protein